MRSALETETLATGRIETVLQTERLIEAPNRHRNGWLLVNGIGRLFRVPLSRPALHTLETGGPLRCSIDHGFSTDGGRSS